MLFRDAPSLAGRYRAFLHHGISTFKSTNVLRFLGHFVPASGKLPKRYSGEINSSLKERPEGVRLRHTVKGNSLNVYDKQGSLLRVETTIVRPDPFKVYRPVETGPEQRLRWQKLRRGVADLWRQGQVSQAAHARYLEALARVTGKTPLRQEAEPVCQSCTVAGRRYRVLNPWSPKDGALLEAISRGEFALAGLRNRDFRRLLYPRQGTDLEERRRAAAITRQLALLRAHKILRKVPGTHRYQITDQRRRILTALWVARQANVDQLTAIAA